jgi:sugar/nucleoside kinase (ribokinase family)
MNTRRGIIGAGNWLRDHVKTIDAWPAENGLANILSHTTGNGGGPYNVLKDLAKLGADYPLVGMGLVGDDADGRTILEDCRRHNIDTAQLRVSSLGRTSYTDVMTVRATGRRTFFHDRGVNAHFAPEHCNFAGTSARVFYFGYLLLLDAMDALDPNGEPRACVVFRAATEAGLLTALDCVSAASNRFRATVLPTLPHIDVLFANDYEAEQLTGRAVRRDEGMSRDEAHAAARELLNRGVRQWVIIHSPEGAVACARNSEPIWQAAVSMPSEQIASTVGAGDAFAAGVLHGVHENWPMTECLELGACAAATSLLHATCSDSVRPWAECLKFGRELGT